MIRAAVALAVLLCTEQPGRARETGAVVGAIGLITANSWFTGYAISAGEQPDINSGYVEIVVAVTEMVIIGEFALSEAHAGDKGHFWSAATLAIWPLALVVHGGWTVTRGSVPEVLPWTLAAAGAIDVMLLQFGFSAAADRRGAALLPVPIGSGSGLALVGRF